MRRAEKKMRSDFEIIMRHLRKPESLTNYEIGRVMQLKEKKGEQIWYLQQSMLKQKD